MYNIYNNRLDSVKCDMKRRKDTSVYCNGVNIMIRHILFWNYTDKVKSEHKEKETLKFLQDSVNTMNGHIDGLMNASIGTNIAGGYDLVFYAELRDEKALQQFQNHPLHAAHKQRCAELVTYRLCGDLVVE